MKIILRNCDYKNLAKEMLEKKIKVDAIITDPPYCVSRTYQLGFSNMGRSGMNYGKWDYGFDQKQWILDVAPLLREGGAFIIFNDWKNMSYIVEALEQAGCVVKDLLRWVKKNPMPRNIDSRYVNDFEVAVWAVKGKKYGTWTFNRPANAPYLKPVFVSGIVPGGAKRIHPTQKQLSVIESIVEIHTNKGDIVFDPFSGSGTTALACANKGRNFVGSEIDKTYYDKSVVRLNGDITTELSGK